MRSAAVPHAQQKARRSWVLVVRVSGCVTASRDEIRRLLDADRQPRIKQAILLMLTTARRVGAVPDLTWDRVDLGRGQVNLRGDMLGPRKGRAIIPLNARLRAP